MVVIRILIILLVADSTTIILKFLLSANASIVKAFEVASVVPDLIPKAPEELATVTYPSGATVEAGNILAPIQVKDIPSVKWTTTNNSFYTLLMTESDAPSRCDTSLSEWHHWLIGNILDTNIDSGNTLSAYIGSGPSFGSGLHRYVFLVYKQPGKLIFNEPPLNNTSGYKRAMFSTTKFADKYKLGDPVAGNFYQAQYDDYVPSLYKQLRI